MKLSAVSGQLSALSRRVSACACVAALVLTTAGCSRESLRVALDAQRRADQVQQAVADRRHEALCVLLYRDALRRLSATGARLTPEQAAALSAAWNDRDLAEFWALQDERARALRLIGVDSKLFADQSTLDLLIKALERAGDRAAIGLAAAAGEQAATQAVQRAAPSAGTAPKPN